MDALFELDLVQNTGLAAEVIFTTVLSYYKERNSISGLPFPLAFLVLPLLFHHRTVEDIKRRKGSGILYKAIKEDREIPIGLQKRMESMFDRTLSACFLAVSADIMTIDLKTVELIPLIRNIPKAALPATGAIMDIFHAANRLGKVFAVHSIEEIIKITEVVF
ncbi:MAG: hypothetical protein IKP58_17295 [Victivallales bacterium]|nr:hypothetical protein [Victivallales bacterium]